MKPSNTTKHNFFWSNHDVVRRRREITINSNKIIITKTQLIIKTPPIFKIQLFSKICVTFEPIMQLISLHVCNTVYFMTGSAISNRMGLAAPYT